MVRFPVVPSTIVLSDIASPVHPVNVYPLFSGFANDIGVCSMVYDDGLAILFVAPSILSYVIVYVIRSHCAYSVVSSVNLSFAGNIPSVPITKLPSVLAS